MLYRYMVSFGPSNRSKSYDVEATSRAEALANAERLLANDVSLSEEFRHDILHGPVFISWLYPAGDPQVSYDVRVRFVGTYDMGCQYGKDEDEVLRKARRNFGAWATGNSLLPAPERILLYKQRKPVLDAPFSPGCI